MRGRGEPARDGFRRLESGNSGVSCRWQPSSGGAAERSRSAGDLQFRQAEGSGRSYRALGFPREHPGARLRPDKERDGGTVAKFLLWCILLFLCWPLALVALVLYPLVWLLLLPFRLLGIAVEGVLQLVWAVVTLPARILGGRV